MKFLVINTEAFSAKGIKEKKELSLDDLPWVVRAFISVFPKHFIILDESSKIKTNVPMKESKKSSRTRAIKLLNQMKGHRCIMSATLASKSPLNLYDQFAFLKEGFFPESMWEFAERYCVMETIRIGRGRRVLIGQKDYDRVRRQLRSAYIRGGEQQLRAAMESVFKQHSIDYAKQDHIIQHRKYSPFINQRELMKRIAPVTMFVKREDVFDIQYDKFVNEPIMRPVRLSAEAKKIANALVDVGFTDRLTLGNAPALELMIRLQDVCNGFEPVEKNPNYDQLDVFDKKPKREILYRPLVENPKLEAVVELLEEIDVAHNQVVVWCSRKPLLRACADRFSSEGYAFVQYDGSADIAAKTAAEEAFSSREAQIFLANQSSGAYGLNCLAQCSYLIYMCINDSVEEYYQSKRRILRGAIHAPKFAYHIYAEGTIEEKQLRALAVGQELISAENTKEIFRVA
jgi:SNF2 family DNA or RNA helicase